MQYYDDAAGILRMVILSAVQPHRLLAAPPQPLPQHPCAVEGSGDLEGSQHGMHYNMSLDDMRSQVAGEEDRWGPGVGRWGGWGIGGLKGCWLPLASIRSGCCGAAWFGSLMVVAARRTSCKPPLHCCLAQTTHPILPQRSPYGELRCVLAVIRHGDRTPKQKMKMKVTQEPLLALLHKHLDSKGKQAKLKVGWKGGRRGRNGGGC